ncbi:unknown [Parabacteroides merdae CAG:48]|nr:unknown [Parabacteroides merdae CAG:48]
MKMERQSQLNLFVFLVMNFIWLANKMLVC